MLCIRRRGYRSISGTLLTSSANCGDRRRLKNTAIVGRWTTDAKTTNDTTNDKIQSQKSRLALSLIFVTSDVGK